MLQMTSGRKIESKVDSVSGTCIGGGHVKSSDGRETSEIGVAGGIGRPGSCGCRHRETLRHALADAIETLEATRRAFKSKQIEALRKRLIRVLIEEA